MSSVLVVVAGWRPFFDKSGCKKDNCILSLFKSVKIIRCCVHLYYAPSAKTIPLSSFNVFVRANVCVCVRVWVCACSIHRVIHQSCSSIVFSLNSVKHWFSIFLVSRPKFPRKNLSRSTWFHFSKISWKHNFYYINIYKSLLGIFSIL